MSASETRSAGVALDAAEAIASCRLTCPTAIAATKTWVDEQADRSAG